MTKIYTREDATKKTDLRKAIRHNNIFPLIFNLLKINLNKADKNNLGEVLYNNNNKLLINMYDSEGYILLLENICSL